MSETNTRGTCIRIFKYRVLPGQEQAYQDYLRDVVEPIDVIAHKSGAFLDHFTIVPEAGDEDWTQARVFTFRDLAQREQMLAKMAVAAAVHDGSEAARDRRKQYAESLRKLIGVFDYRLS